MENELQAEETNFPNNKSINKKEEGFGDKSLGVDKRNLREEMPSTIPEEIEDIPSVIILEVEPYDCDKETVAPTNDDEPHDGKTCGAKQKLEKSSLVMTKETVATCGSESNKKSFDDKNSSSNNTTLSTDKSNKVILEEARAKETTSLHYRSKEGMVNVGGSNGNGTSQYISASVLTTSSMKTPFEIISLEEETDTGDAFISTTDSSDQLQDWHPSKASLCPNEKRHNLSIPELRKKLAFCPICQIQYNSHKLANMCLAKHGKRQCWLCLDILSSKKEDFYLHCMQYHSVSSTGEIVGCPFCGKFFDFRQGLNQHIVKIHFSESISDIDAVSSLSPTTLVDIYTGKPRSMTSDTADIQYQQQPLASNEVFGSESITVCQSCSQSQDYIALNSGLSYSTANLTPTMPLPQQFGYERDILHNKFLSCHTNLNKTSSSNHNSLQSSVSSLLLLSPDDTNNLSRPSVITQWTTHGTVQKMNVPPEQTLSSLQEELGVAGLPPLDCGTMHRQREPFDHDQNGSFLRQEENIVEVLENESLKLQKYLDAGLNYYYSKGAPISLQNTQIRTTSQSEKNEKTMLNSEENKDFSKIGSLSNSNLSKENSDLAYEQVITRVTNVNTCTCTPLQAQQTSPELAGNVNRTMPTFGIMSSSNTEIQTLTPTSNPQNEISALEQVTSALSEIDKDYSDIEFSNALAIPDKVITEDGSSHVGVDYSSLPQTLIDGASSTSSYFAENNICSKSGPTLIQEIKSRCVSPKFPDNCGVKRRILMKAMWDEHQHKRPAVAPSHALVHHLQRGASLFNPSATQKANALEKTITFNQGFSESIYASQLMDHEQKKRNGDQQKLQNQMLSGGILAKDAGPFFEKYVKRDKRRNEDHLKLLNLTRSSKTLPEQRFVSQAHHTPVSAWSHFSQSQASINSGNTQYKSCARYESTTITPVSGSGGGSCVSSLNNQSGNTPRQQSFNKWMLPSFPNMRPQYCTPQFRKPSNPAFWDGLRARLMLAQAQGANQRGKGEMQIRSDAYSTPAGKMNGRPRTENIVVQNPFEEDLGHYVIKQSTHPNLIGSSNPGRFHFPHEHIDLAQSVNDAQFKDHSAGNSMHSSMPPVTQLKLPPYPKYRGRIKGQDLQQTSSISMSRPFTHFPSNLGESGTRVLNEEQNHQKQLLMHKVPTSPQTFMRNSAQPVFFAPQYSEQHQNFLNKLHSMDKSKALN